MVDLLVNFYQNQYLLIKPFSIVELHGHYYLCTILNLEFSFKFGIIQGQYYFCSFCEERLCSTFSSYIVYCIV